MYIVMNHIIAHVANDEASIYSINFGSYWPENIQWELNEDAKNEVSWQHRESQPISILWICMVDSVDQEM